MLATMRRKFLICLALLFALSVASILPLCALMFRCGCTFSALEQHCNVHDPTPPHCPWCEGGVKVFLPGYVVAIVLAGGCSWMSLRRWRPSLPLALSSGIVIYGSLMSLSGLITARLMHYPTWFGIQL
jgi:hypothetical protein